MKEIVYCLCTNYNCEWEGMAEPFSYCANCGECVVEPIDEWCNMGHIDEGGVF